MQKTYLTFVGLLIAGHLGCGGGETSTALTDGGSARVGSVADGGSIPDGGATPSIITQPSNQSVTVPDTATFTVVAAGIPPLRYQWKKNGSDISGATQTSYTTPATSLADYGATFTVVVSNSAGSVTSSPATLTVQPSATSRLFAYVANKTDKTVSAFSVNQITGALTALSPATYSTDADPWAVAAAKGKFIYVGCSQKVDVFRVDLHTGELTAIAGSPYAVAGVTGYGMAVSPDGNYLYVGGGANKVYSFLIHGDGTLGAVSGSPFTSGSYNPVRLSAGGSFVFASAGTDVLVFRSNSGALAAPDRQTAAQIVYDFVATPDGHYAYAADYYAAVKAYTVDLTTGIMTPQAGAYTAEPGFSTRGSVVSPNGKYLYALNRGGDVTKFDISPNGSLSPANGTVYRTGLNETFEHIVMDPDGRFLYVTNNEAAPHNFVMGFTVNGTTGALTQMPSFFLAGVNEQGMAFIKVP